MKEFRAKLQRNAQHFMIGRYGTDELSIFLIRLALVVMLLSIIPKLSLLAVLSWTLLLIGVYRSLSRKITARSRERDWYLSKTCRISSRFNTYKRIWADRKTHRYFKCKNCKSFVRVPRGKGRIEISCTKCRCKMIRKT